MADAFLTLSDLTTINDANLADRDISDLLDDAPLLGCDDPVNDILDAIADRLDVGDVLSLDDDFLASQVGRYGFLVYIHALYLQRVQVYERFLKGALEGVYLLCRVIRAAH